MKAPRGKSISGDRRDFLRSVVGAAAVPWMASVGSGLLGAEAGREKLPVAAVVTVYHPQSHTDVIVGKILEGWQQDGGLGPDLKLASIYVDQIGPRDLSRNLSEKHGFRIAKTIDEALTLGTDRLQVAGVLSIGEHGDYPYTPDTKQHMYPRRRFFEEIAATFRRVGKSVPVFNDKHLSYKWEDAKFMYDTARELKIPFLAGSSVPVGWRYPVVQLDRTDELESAVTVGWDGLEVYGFHALEIHQAMIERRRGGEAGIVSVQALKGDAIHRAADEGRWSPELLKAALATLPGDLLSKPDWTKKEGTALYLLEHRDGLKSAVAMTGFLTPHFAFAGKIKGRPEPVATWIKLQEGKPYGHFAHLLKAIEETIHSGRAVYPVERTLLTTGVLDRAMHSLAKDNCKYETPELATIAYEPTDWTFANHPTSKLKTPEPQ